MASVVKPDKAFIVVDGPVKKEYIFVKDVTSGESVPTKLAGPILVKASQVNSVTPVLVAAALSGKDVTITFAGGGTQEVLVEVFGDAIWA